MLGWNEAVPSGTPVCGRGAQPGEGSGVGERLL